MRPRINNLNMITCQGKTRLPMLAREICANQEKIGITLICSESTSKTSVTLQNIIRKAKLIS